MTPNDQTLARLEALLFLHGEPLPRRKIAELLKISKDEAAGAVESFRQSLAQGSRGLALLSAGDSVQLVTKPELSDLVEQFLKGELREALTPATVETLALVAYFGPVQRSRVEYIRGVNSSFTLRNLLVRGLVERVPNPRRLHGYLYQTTAAFLQHLGITEREALPEFERFRSLLETYSGEAAPQANP